MRRLIPLVLCSVSALSGLAAKDIQFNRDIRPILSENCFLCHGPDKNTRQAGLRLDVREPALEKGAIVPGDPEASKIAQRIHAGNEMLRMPPVWSGKKLKPEQKQLLVEWIKQGAEYQQHWAYIPPQRPEAPEGPAAIDYFIHQRLEEEGLEPAGEADRRTLARRVSLDLTGLPPEPETVEAFVNDASPDAYRKLVERYLSSPQFGERMAVHWLDLVRYADTTGYHGDQPINVYPYRDYVIRAFNENKPFDEFTREQLAGDLLPNPTPWQRVASAYNRLNRITNEGGAQAKEYLAKYASDRVRNLTEVWLGSTLGCAECHDHKFDPFLTKDFYEMEAFFAGVKEKGVYRGNVNFGSKMRLLPVDAKIEAEKIGRRLEKLRKNGGKLDAAGENLERFAAYLREGVEQWRPLEPVRAAGDCSDPDIDTCGKFELEIAEGGVVEFVEKGDMGYARKGAYSIEFGPESGPLRALQLEVLPSEECREFHLSEFEVRLLGRGERPQRLKVEAFVPDWEEEDSRLRNTQDGNHHSVWKGKPLEEGPRRAAFVFSKRVELREGERLRVTPIFDGLARNSIAERLRILGTRTAFPRLPSQGVLRAAALAAGERTYEQQRALERAFRQTTKGNPHWREILKLERRKKSLWDHAHETLVTESVEPRTIRVLPRGNWMDDSGEIVEPRTPHFLRQISAGGDRPTRLDLANWLVSRDNPLTARVFVNRLWEMFFGTGISKVLDDLGSQGEPPVHPELLDWLAVEFMESGWDVKHIIRTMLLSETYRRTSEPAAELEKADPFNRLHGRQSPIRLDAEFIRDSALAVSGLLNPKIGGPSVKPYQPKGYYKELNFPKREYKPDLNGDQFRRGLYTHWQRLFLHPSLMAFDAPPRENCTAQRAVSNTPLQSLTLLNDPSYIEAARNFAARILQSDREGAAAKIGFAFRRALARPPNAQEEQVLLELLRSQRRYFEADPARAAKLLATGVSPVPEDLEQTELAAWTSVARALFNKHEFIVRY